MVGEEERLNVPEGAHTFERDDVIQGVEVAERLLAAQFWAAVLLQAWSMLEATLRLLAEEVSVTLKGLSSSITTTLGSRRNFGA